MKRWVSVLVLGAGAMYSSAVLADEVKVAVAANFKGTIERIGKEFTAKTGHIEQIAPATGSEFSVIKADNASGNFIKIVQRLPIRIAIDPGQVLAERLRPGMSVEAAVDTRAAEQAAKERAAAQGAQP